ncbi:MAG TPA: MoaD/ThiS family protein [Rhizobiales bacterium]|nr:MoaD/ThiS family protein [Hyphomicrobiales bacterium]
MKITFKTGGMIADILPEGCDDDQTVLDLPDGAVITQAMAQLGLPEDDFYLVILNDVVCPKKARATTRLSDGDELGIYPPLKGG